MIKNILGFGIPNGIENGMFQIGRLTVQGLVATFGTAAIAANAIASSISGFMNIPGSAMALAMITVVGQCVGADEYDWAVFYTKKLLKVAYASMGILGVLLFFTRLPIVKMFNLSAEATAGATQLLGLFSIFAIIFWTPSFVLPNALRAAGDNKFTMMVSMASMWIFRIGFSYVVGQYYNMGLMGVWIAMIIDWVARSAVFVWRFRNDKWKKAKVV